MQWLIQKGHICVHISPNVYKHTLLLFEGLAEHVLVELQIWWVIENGKELSKERRNELVCAIISLCHASGCKINTDIDELFIVDILSKFALGTEKTPPTVKPRSTPKHYRICDLVTIQSPLTQAKETVQGEITKVIYM